MNLVEFWQSQITKWNADEKCGLCWKFYAPLTQSQVNIAEISEADKCCVQVYLLRDKVTAFSVTNGYNDQTGLMNKQTCNTGFQLLVVIGSDIGKNNFNEVSGYDTDESKWSEIYSRLEACLSCDLNLDFCEFVGSQYRVTQWTAKQEADILDGYSGFRLTCNFQTVG